MSLPDTCGVLCTPRRQPVWGRAKVVSYSPPHGIFPISVVIHSDAKSWQKKYILRLPLRLWLKQQSSLIHSPVTP